MRKLISLFAALILTVHMTSCTSKDSKDDVAGGDEAVAAETAGTDAELQALDAPPAASSDPSVASKEGTNEGFLDDQLPSDALGETNKTANNDTPPTPEGLDATTAPPPTMEEPKTDALAENKLDSELAPPPEANLPGSPVASIDPGSAISPDPTPIEKSPDLSSASSMSEPASTPIAESKPKASLQKVEAVPMTREGILLNAVYIARPGDNYKKISSLIYGNPSKQKELKKANASIHKPKPGDKIYYNSPVRSTDDTKLLTYYEDAGIAPEIYVAQDGDDLKKVSKKILGYNNAWKEIWETNSVDSKGALTAGTELRYWKAAPASEMAPPKATVAANTASPTEMALPPPMPEMPPAPPAEMAPPPPPTAEMAPPSPDGGQAVANNSPPPPPVEMAPPPPPDLPPPPPPPAEAVNPPPPPAVAKKSADTAVDETGLDKDMVMTLAGVGILALGAFAFIILRKRRQTRDAAVAFNDTQVGT